MDAILSRLGNLRYCGDRVALLTQRYYEQVQDGLEFTLEMLALIGSLPDFAMIAASLQSASEKVRANALETIETSVGPDLFDRLKPIIDARPTSAARPAAASAREPELIEALASGMWESDELVAGTSAEALAALAPDRLLAEARTLLLGRAPGLLTEIVDAQIGLARGETLTLLRQLRAAPQTAGAKLSSLLTVVRATNSDLLPALLERAEQLSRRYPDLALSLLAHRTQTSHG